MSSDHSQPPLQTLFFFFFFGNFEKLWLKNSRIQFLLVVQSRQQELRQLIMLSLHQEVEGDESVLEVS